MRRRYGAGPLHLLGHVALLGVVAYALSRAFEPRFAPEPVNLLAWLIGGALVHDLVLLPAYSALDAAAVRTLGPRLLNHVRVPFVLSAVVFLVYAPRILDRQPRNVVNALGVEPPDYLARWALLTAALFGVSASLYGIRAARARRGRAGGHGREAARGDAAGAS
jgi:hypothetical protein